MTLSSRGFYSTELSETAKYVTELFKYDKVLFMNGGVESGE